MPNRQVDQTEMLEPVARASNPRPEPEHGVPITVKDNVAIGGRKLANGSRGAEGFLAPDRRRLARRLARPPANHPGLLNSGGS